MALQIPEDERIQNVSPLPDDFDATDPTLLNADWVMNIFDKIVNGEYNVKPFTVYDTLADLQSEEDVEAGQAAYVAAEPGHFFLYNGTSWLHMPNMSEIGDAANNSTITLAADGIIQGSFTLNQATDATIDFDVTQYIAGNGITISDSTISTIGTQLMTVGTDIDTLTTEGTYYIQSPTSTLGLPILNYSTSSYLLRWDVLVNVEKIYFPLSTETADIDYCIKQTATFIPIGGGSGIGILQSPTYMYMRTLADNSSYAYMSFNWKEITTASRVYTGITVDTSTGTTTLTPTENTFYTISKSQYSSSPHDFVGLTLTNIPDSSKDIHILFTPDDDFELTETQLTWLNQPKSTKFISGVTYLLTINHLYATLSNVGINTFLDYYVDTNKTKIIAGDNITTTPDGWQGFSSTKYLTYTAPTLSSNAYGSYIKFTLNSSKTNTLLYCVHADDNTYCILGVNNSNQIFVTSYNTSSSAYSTITGSTTLEVGKTYWIRTLSSGTTPLYYQVYTLEDNNYHISTLPSLSSWSRQISSPSYTFHIESNDTVYIGYNPTSTSDYFDGVLGTYYCNNVINLATATEGTDFTNVGCEKGTKVSSTASGSSGTLYTFEGTTGTVLDTNIELTENIMVFKNGLLQTVEDDYSYITDGTTISFIESLLNTDKISVITSTISATTGTTVNDNTISITVDGVTQGSFTTNQATDSTIPLTIAPTNQTVSGEYVELACEANINYWLETVSGLTISSIETSPLETNIYFTTDSTAFSFANTSGLSQWLGTTPSFDTGTQYVINICNGIGALAPIVTEE